MSNQFETTNKAGKPTQQQLVDRLDKVRTLKGTGAPQFIDEFGEEKPIMLVRDIASALQISTDAVRKNLNELGLTVMARKDVDGGDFVLSDVFVDKYVSKYDEDSKVKPLEATQERSSVSDIVDALKVAHGFEGRDRTIALTILGSYLSKSTEEQKFNTREVDIGGETQ
jgi:hypothetical protein